MNAEVARERALAHNYSGEMGETTTVDVVARLAQWKVDLPCAFKRSDPFNINGWNWRLSVEMNRVACIRLSFEPGKCPEEQRPFARVVIRVTGANRRSYTFPTYDKVPQSDVCTPGIDMNWKSPLVISVEFLDLRIRSPNWGGEVRNLVEKYGEMISRLGPKSFPGSKKSYPSWSNEFYIAQCRQGTRARSSSRSFSHMLNDSVHADIIIATSNGKLKAHKAILSTSSPIFCSMFKHNFKENVSSTIEIKDMTSESCMALLRFMYGGVKHEEFWNHRLELLAAANKYDIKDLKDACEGSLLEDIDANNVFDRLQEAWLYKLGKLKDGCFRYLLDFGQIHHVSTEKKHDFLRQADRVLVVEMFDKMLVAGVTPLGPDPSVAKTKA